MGSAGGDHTPVDPQEEEAFLFAMQLGSASVLPMVLKSAVELDLLETIAKFGPGAFVPPSELAAQLPTQNPDAPVMLDRILRLLTSYSVLNCTLKTLPDGGVERPYGLAPVSKFLIKNADGVSLAPILLMNQDKVLMESWYVIPPSQKINGCFDYFVCLAKLICDENFQNYKHFPENDYEDDFSSA